MKTVAKKIIRKVQYIANKTARYTYPPVNGPWKKWESPVYGDESTGSVFDPCVVRGPEGYRLYVSERLHHGVDLCVSEDGIHWTRMGQALAANPDSGWEQKVNRVSVCCVNDRWYLWYTGQHAAQSSIGLAISRDGGKTFTRTSETPVLRADQPFEKQSVMNPCVMWDETQQRFRMWYAAGEQFEPDVLGYAESEDGIHWEKQTTPILEKSEHLYDGCKVGGCDVKKLAEEEYVMYYIGYQNVDTARICMAHSKDGIHWTREEENPILSPKKGAWDQDAVYKPGVLYGEQEISLWYNGRSSNHEYIGYATAPRER